MRGVVPVGLALLLLASACGDDNAAGPSSTTTTTVVTTTTTAPSTTTTTAATTTTATTMAVLASLEGDVVYLGDQDGGTVIAVDGASGGTLGIADIGASPDWMAVGHGVLWVLVGATTDARLLRLDPVTLSTLSDLDLEGTAFDLTVTDSGVWTLWRGPASENASMVRVTPDGAGLGQEVDIDCGTVPTAGGLAVVHYLSLACGVLFGWDEAGVLVRVAELPDANGAFFSTDAGTVYVPADGGVYRVTPEGDIGFVTLGEDISAVAIGEAALWAASFGSLWRIDANTSTVIELVADGAFVWGPVVGQDAAYAVADGSLWRTPPEGEATAIAEVPDGVRRLAVATDPVATGGAAVAAPDPGTEAPDADTLMDEAVATLAHFYPDHILLARIDRPAETGVGDVIDLIASSDATPAFQIIVRMRRLAPGVSSAAEGCDLEFASGVRWCHSTGATGLQAWAGAEPMMPAPIRAEIEATFATAHPDVLVVDFRLHSNVEISLAWITQDERVGWDGESFSAESTWDNDIGAGVWRER